MTNNIKSILKKRPKIPRKSKKGLMKRKVIFKDEKNQEKYYFLSDMESYQKSVMWRKILMKSQYYYLVFND